ncbi:MAG: putative NADH-quinone oxidoreductase, subunit [Nitrospira sp.]|jgi:NADH-quinone oxidoreductase subunit L|nr:putative NADH-quinone oxidoreductase, subunit [Nitrospira sp.]
MPFLVLVPLLPLLTALFVLTGKSADQERNAKAGIFPVLAAFLGSLITLLQVTSEGPITLRLYDPAAVANFAFPIGFYIDRLSAVMMVLISGVTTLIYRYSMGYMYQDRGYRRYLGVLGITTTVLLCMVSSANLVMLFVFWQILSWLLFVLAHNHAHAATLAGASNTFTLLRLCDVAFLAGIVLAYSLYGTFEFQTLFTRAAEIPVTLSIWPQLGWEMNGVTAVTLLIFVGAMGKSAQFPVHTWLPRSLYAPTPVHALLHAGIINAGGFLLNRLAPLYGQSSSTLHVVFIIGTLTAILGATMMLTQNDIKKTLGFSTIGQMGYMIMECGLGAFSLAVFHLVAHGLFKATVFLNCGNVIHKARQEPSFPKTNREAEEREFSNLTWSTGFLTTLFLPLVILLVTHGALRIPLLESQGTVIFLFFIWVTSSQAILSLTRIRAVASWKVSAAMLLTLLLVVFTYLFAVESFTHFLYPNPDEVASYFRAAALPGRLFDVLVAGTTLLTVISWFYLYAQAHGRRVRIPDWFESFLVRLYVLFMNRLYLDQLYVKVGRSIVRAAHRLEKRLS